MSTSAAKQSGFSMVVSIIAAVLVIGLIAFIGWRLYDQHNQPSKQTNNTTQNSQNTNQTPTGNNQSSTPAQPVDPNAGYFVIKEWGVRLKPASELSGLSYSITSSQRPDATEAMLMTNQLKATNIAECNGSASGSRPLGAIVRTSTAEDLSQHMNSDQLLAHINGYYYYYYEPAQLCDPDPNSNTINNLQSSTLTMIKTSLTSLEAAK